MDALTPTERALLQDLADGLAPPTDSESAEALAALAARGLIEPRIHIALPLEARRMAFALTPAGERALAC